MVLGDLGLGRCAAWRQLQGWWAREYFEQSPQEALTAGEYPEMDSAARQVAPEHKQSVRRRFMQLAQETGALLPDALAYAQLLVDGAPANSPSLADLTRLRTESSQAATCWR
jgi:hypothetical protein